MKEYLHKLWIRFHNYNDLHDCEYTDKWSLTNQPSRYCPVCKKKEVEYATHAGLFWAEENLKPWTNKNEC